MSETVKKCPEWFFNQSGVIPYTIEDEQIKVMLITSKKKKKWIIPKGIIEPEMSPRDSAAKEAYEEAGITGRVFKEEITNYIQEKWGGECSITIFLMKIDKIFDQWEEDFRKRKLFTPGKAAEKIKIKPLKKIIKNIEGLI
ncbi:MAG: NUDIX domain-containing protein [Victivallales bacterium]|nr:NUDIX domain-containing protein [Victivallales bacterium]MCF7888612.1 NUDIX domain-containing protein [Victivallales bacterium]